MNALTHACGKCGASPWVHYMKGSTTGWLFCDASYAAKADFPLAVIADTYQVAGKRVPAKLVDAARRETKTNA